MKFLADATGNDKKVAVLNEVLSKVQKMMLEDVWVSDAIARRCITLFANFLLGKRTVTTVDVNREVLQPDLQEQIVAHAFNEAELNKFKMFVDRINRQTKFHDKLEGAVIQTQIGGRSVLKIETESVGAEGGEPVDLKLLNWGKLGRVFADKNTWQLLGVEYADRAKDEPLRADEIIYFAWQDYNISPDSMYHGNSALLPVVDICETKRIILSEDLKEAAKVSTSDAGMVKFPPNTSRQAMDQFTKQFIGGQWHATSSDVTVETFDLRPKIQDMTNTVKEFDSMIITGLGLPEYVINSKNVPNRAVADVAMNVWREADLNHARTWLRGIIEPQWYDSLMLIHFGEDIDVGTFWAKCKLEFEDITYETLKDKAETVIMLMNAGLMTIEKACKILDLEDVLEQIQAQQKLMQQQQKRELEMMRLERENQQNNSSAPSNGQPDTGEEDDPEAETEDDNRRKPRIRAKQASDAEAMRKEFEKQKQELLEKLVKASEAKAQPVTIKNNNKEEETALQKRQIDIMEREANYRMKILEGQQELVNKGLARLEALQKKNSS